MFDAKRTGRGIIANVIDCLVITKDLELLKPVKESTCFQAMSNENFFIKIITIISQLCKEVTIILVLLQLRIFIQSFISMQSI